MIMAASNHTSSSSSIDSENQSAPPSMQASSRRNGNGNGEEQLELEHPPAAAAVDAVRAATSDPPELVDNASGLPLPIDMLDGGFVEGSRGLTPRDNDAAVASSRGSAPPAGLEVMDMEDSSGLPVPIGLYEQGDCNKVSKRGGVDVIEDDTGPEDPLASLEQRAKISLANDLSPPTPFNPFALEEVVDGKKKANTPSDVDSIIVPTREDIEDEDPPFNNILESNRGDIEGGQIPPIHNQMNVDSNQPSEESTVDTGGANDATDYHDLEQGSTGGADLEQDRETQIITEAYPVEERSDDGIVIQGHAEPLLPWYRQRKPRLLLGAFASVIAILVIAFGVSFSSNRKDTVPATTNLALRTNVPSQSKVPSDAPSTTKSPSDRPSLRPTTVPSTEPSPIPSYSPSACVNKISSNAKMIDLQIDDPQYVDIAIDGKDMVVVARQGVYCCRAFIIFYSLSGGEWQRANIFQEDSLGWHSDVALSGNTAFVGFRYANDDTGTVLIYEKDQFGDWGLMEDSFIQHDASETHSHFGRDVDIDGDLACVGGHDDSSGDGRVSLYRRENDKWIQFDSIENEVRCSVRGYTIAITGWDIKLQHYYLQLYRYNQEMDEVFPVQDPIPSGSDRSLDLSHDYLVYWDDAQGAVFMGRREERSHTYTFFQQLNIPDIEFGPQAVALDNDILVVRGGNKTHIFSQGNDGKWEETITMDQYWRYALSGRRLITASLSDNVYYFDIEGCSQAMPTQTPSFYPSSIPSMSPSSSPSMSSSPTTIPSLSLYPSKSSSPTTTPSSSSSPTEECYWVQVAIKYDDYAEETSWNIQRVDRDDGNYELVKSHVALEGDTFYTEFICLERAEYVFAIDDYGWGGICCQFGEGHYNVTSNGLLIAEGGDFGRSERTTFSVPFVPPS